MLKLFYKKHLINHLYHKGIIYLLFGWYKLEFVAENFGLSYYK